MTSAGSALDSQVSAPARSAHDARIAHIAVVSFAVLVLELAFIRLVPAEVRVVSYFTNLLLFASFCGLGLGAILQSYRDLSWTLPIGLLSVAGYVAFARGLVIYDQTRQVHFWLEYEEVKGQAITIPVLPAVAAAFASCCLSFVSLGQKLARLMDAHPRLRAYGWDIAGSLIGTVVFALGSAFGAPPWIWPPLVAVLWLVVAQRSLAAYATCVAGAAFLLFGVRPSGSGTRQWSPYYLIDARPESGGLRVFVNSSFHQLAINFRDTDPKLAARNKALLAKFETPYRDYRARHFHPPERVLILGAGTGNDVFVALENQAKEVVAVEIDPVILQLGKSRNAARPYADPRVRTVNDDGRHFLRATRERFDLIIFGTLDSQTLLSGRANLRLDNFVYTRESIADARRVLADDGMLGMYYSVYPSWLYGRLLRTAAVGFGSGCALQTFGNAGLFNAVVLCTASGEASEGDPAVLQMSLQAEPATDDWPFVYLEHRTIAPIYLQSFALLVLLIAVIGLVVRKQYPGERARPEFFLLGIGFALVESAAIVRLSLLFGSTWVVNAVVFASVLATIFAANAAVLRGQAPRLLHAWIGVIVTLVINAVFPVQWLLSAPTAGRVAAAAWLVGAPMFYAAVCFSRLFASQRTTGLALGINLIGAMAGGGVEYLSMILGMSAIWWLAVVVYALAWLASRRAPVPQAATTSPYNNVRPVSALSD
jgi:hypothetical protein